MYDAVGYVLFLPFFNVFELHQSESRLATQVKIDECELHLIYENSKHSPLNYYDLRCYVE